MKFIILKRGMSGMWDIVNSIVAFQLIFFTMYLFLKGQRIPSTLLLKIHLISQLIFYPAYWFFTHEYSFLKPVLLISLPSMLIWAPTFYLYIESRLYTNFALSWKLLLHAIPAVIMVIIIYPIIYSGEDFRVILANKVGSSLYYYVKFQIFVYNVYTLYIIYKYRYQIKFVTSSSEKQKINWLLFITYGLTLNSLSDLIVDSILNTPNQGWGYLIFFIFLNMFFFKAILQPDQFLGIDEKKLLPVKVTSDKSKDHFNNIEEIIISKQLFLDPDLSLHNISQAVKLSDRMVSQVIRQNTNLNFTDYINRKRIDYAKDVLKSTTRAEKNVLEILYEAGFNSKSVFNTQFKKHTGLSPTEFRESNYKRPV
jgi:AraC-like DNA-binding protein